VRFLDAGDSELLKRNLHGALGLIVAGFAIYNLAAIFQRPHPQRHLFMNALMYGSLVVVEVMHAQHHEASR
jgi:hypothetical protein